MPRIVAAMPLVLALALALAQAAAAAEADKKFTAFEILTGLMAGGKEVAPAAPEPMHVIGVGLGRTGTSSLKAALTKLGYKTYHMGDGVIDSGHLPLWHRYALAKIHGPRSEHEDAAPAALEALLARMSSDGFNATTDFPACLLGKELLQRYPRAVVVLSVRSSGEQWAQSVLATIGRMGQLLGQAPFRFLPFFQHFHVLDGWIWRSILGPAGFPSAELGGLEQERLLARGYDAWLRKVQADFPADKLLVHNAAQDGWAPLCAHLQLEGAACPAGAYPRSNERADLMKVVATLEFIARFWRALALLLLVVTSLLLRACKRRCCDKPSEADKATGKHAKAS